MNENLKKAAEMLKNDNTLTEKLRAEAKRHAETTKDKEANEILAQAITNTLGIEITAKDLDSGIAGLQELTPDALANVAGGDCFVEDIWNQPEPVKLVP